MLGGGFLFAGLPSSSNYGLQSYQFGSGGGVGVSSQYKAEGQVGEVAGSASSGNYQLGAGLIPYQQAPQPPAPTLVNTSGWYNRLHLTVVQVGGVPGDARYTIAVSTDSFATTLYLQSDGTVGATLGAEDTQTYTAWGGVSGVDMVGLTGSTTYQVKVRATYGAYTEGSYGTIASASTVAPTLSFGAGTGTVNSAGPYVLSFGSLLAGSIADGSSDIWLTLATNTSTGASAFMKSTNGGLRSSSNSFTITSASADLAVASSGYGVRVASTSTDSGTLTAQSPFAGASHVVGALPSNFQELVRSGGEVVNGAATLTLSAKADSVVPAADDYGDTLTLVAAATLP